MTNKNDGVRALTRALNILELFTEENKELTLSEIAHKLDLPKATVLRLTHTLEQFQYLERKETDKKYNLGPKLFLLGSIVLNKMDIRTIALPIMEKLNKLTGETIHLNIREGKNRICIESIDSIHDLRITIKVGQHSPIYAGASAKVLLAFLDDREIEIILKNLHLKKITENTITDINSFYSEIEKIRARGYALSRGERITGSVGLSVPVINYKNKVLASLSAAFPEARLTEEKLNFCLKELLIGKEEISKNLL